MSLNDETTIRNVYEMLEDELERQQIALDTRLALSRAIKCRDIAAVQSITQTLTVLIQESAEAEKQRLAIMAPLCRRKSKGETIPTLSDLIASVQFPWKLRFSELQQRFEQVINQTILASKENEALLAHAINIVSGALTTLNHTFCGENDRRYNANGRECPRKHSNPVIMDSRG